MERLPKFLAQRLRRTQNEAETHPEADVLAAFAERRLSKAERNSVLAHLAGCPECRDVVAFVAQPVAETHPRSFVHWRWIGAAVAACLALAVVFWRPAVISTPAYVTQTPKSSAVASASKIEKPIESASPGAVHQTKAHAGKAIKSTIKPSPQPPQLARSEVRPDLEASHRFAPAETDRVNLQSESLPAAPAPASVVGGATPETTPAAQSYKLGDESSLGLFAKRTVISRAASPMAGQSLWNISAQAGELRRSNDGGRIWTPITVDAKTNLFALSVAGHEIWAGGEGGVLFRSRDNGATWNQVIVFGGSERLSDAITRIETANERQIRVVTESSAWVSLDGGQTWRKQ